MSAHDDPIGATEALFADAVKSRLYESDRRIERRGRGNDLGPESIPVGRTLSLTRASSIRPRPVRWLWDGRLAMGTLALLGGREGVGKTILAYTLAADVTQGRLNGACHESPRAVIVCATEDSWEHTIVPRLMAAGADLARVFRVDAMSPGGSEAAVQLPTDLTELERVVKEVGAALLILDPLLSRLSADLDSHKDGEVRQALEPLVTLAGRVDACVLGLIHVNKGDSTDALTMLMGSRAFAAVARSVLFAMVDPADEERRLLGTPKNNLGRTDLPTLAFRIDGVIVATTTEGAVWTGRLEWLGESERSIRDAIEASTERSESKTATTEAAAWLSDYLVSQTDGRADSASIKRAANQAGHSIDAVKRARHRLNVASVNVGFPRRTYWSLANGRGPSAALTAPTAPTEAAVTAPSVQSVQSEQVQGEGTTLLPPCDPGCRGCDWCDGPDREPSGGGAL